MKFTREQRLEIGRKIYVGKITKTEASITYNIDSSTARAYMRYYRNKNGLPLRSNGIEV